MNRKDRLRKEVKSLCLAKEQTRKDVSKVVETVEQSRQEQKEQSTR
ncbi:unnamed protein product [marine sediment metagenome]|uniref:Uncharacterized protein n=1 Tax=marine sediment metagenome TaxID=412755 RepID=X1S1U7_9ZZZZ